MSSDNNRRVESPVHDTLVESSRQPPTLSVQDVRTKRLLALGITQAQSISKDEVNKLLMRKDRSNGSKENQNVKVGRSVSAKTTPQIIDLFNDSSDEDDILVVAKRLQRQNSHDDDLLEVATKLEKRKSTHTAKEDTNHSKKHKATEEVKQIATKRPSSSYASIPTAATSRPTGQNSKSSPTNVLFQVATWNVWFGPQGNGSPHAAARMRAISHLLQEQHSDDSPLWCIGLQEVIDETARVLQPSLQCAGYQIFRQPLAPAYGCALAVHSTLRVLEQGWIPYAETCMSRGFLYARVEIPFSAHQIIFTTTHLESFNGPNYTGAQQRPLQLRQMQDFCVQQCQTHATLQTAVMTGDMNWDDERSTRSSKESMDPVMVTELNGAWRDSWLETKVSASATCYTYDGKMNPMLGGNLRRRFDRILVQGSSTRTVSTKVLGTEALPDLTWSKYSHWTKSSKEMPTAPSDHFGYAASFRMN